MLSGISSLFSDPASFLMELLYTLPAILIGLTVHEWAHAFAAYKLGDPTAKNLGRMTLNPVAHIDPIGILLLLFAGFGWARPVPVNPRNYKNFRRDDIIVSLAGITANLIVAFLATFPFYFGLFVWGLMDNAAFYEIMSAIIGINLSLAVFNLIPLYPLDGSHVAESLLMKKIPRVFLFLRQYGQYILLGLLVTGALGRILTPIVSALFQAFSWVAVEVVSLFL